MYRYRESDFRPRPHMGGTAPGWPLTYADLAQCYDKAEALFRVRGIAGEDLTEPPHATAYSHPPSRMNP